MNIAIDSY